MPCVNFIMCTNRIVDGAFEVIPVLAQMNVNKSLHLHAS